MFRVRLVADSRHLTATHTTQAPITHLLLLISQHLKHLLTETLIVQTGGSFSQDSIVKDNYLMMIILFFRYQNYYSSNNHQPQFHYKREVFSNRMSSEDRVKQEHLTSSDSFYGRETPIQHQSYLNTF